MTNDESAAADDNAPGSGSDSDTAPAGEFSQSGTVPAAEASGSDRPEGQAADSAAEERDKLKQQLMRTAADFENFRRRSRREVEEARMKGKDDAVIELLPIIDNLERAVQASEGASDVTAVISGVQMVLKMFEDTASRMGLNRVQAVGERFDPAIHDAIQQQETAEHAPGTIVAEIAAGYMFGKRLIRPAMVIVARAPKEAPAAASEASADDAGATPASTPPEVDADADVVDVPDAEDGKTGAE